jgi:hypothetical protein
MFDDSLLTADVEAGVEAEEDGPDDGAGCGTFLAIGAGRAVDGVRWACLSLRLRRNTLVSDMVVVVVFVYMMWMDDNRERTNYCHCDLFPLISEWPKTTLHSRQRSTYLILISLTS